MSLNIITTIELEDPIEDMGNTITYLDISKPTVAIFREANKKSNGDATEMGFLLAERCSGLSPKGFGQLTPATALKIIEVVEPFLGSSVTKI